MRCYLFDIDGTLADCSHRLHHIQKKPKDWRSFFGSVDSDEPIWHIVNLCTCLTSDATIVLVSGRSDECRNATEQWLRRNGIAYSALYMRKAGDHRSDDIVKGELLDQILADNWRPIMAFDDRDRVVAMWRSRGIPCAQVAPGDF